jgi:putative transposase
VLRYSERNPLQANLVSGAAEWAWSSLGAVLKPPALPWLAPGPVGRGTAWRQFVNQPHSAAELARLRQSVQRGSPFGNDAWTKATAAALGLEFTLRPRGRPRHRLKPAPPTEPGLFA